MRIGSAVLARRQAVGLTLTALAKRAGVSKGMLSDIEHDKKSPTLRLLSSIAEALGTTISELVDESKTRAQRPIEIVEAKTRATFVDPANGARRSVLSHTMQLTGIEVVNYLLPPKINTGEFAAHRRGVVENVTILRGMVNVIVGKRCVMLSRGDSLTYRADSPHRFVNQYNRVAELMLIIDSTSAAPHSRDPHKESSRRK